MGCLEDSLKLADPSSIKRENMKGGGSKLSKTYLRQLLQSQEAKNKSEAASLASSTSRLVSTANNTSTPSTPTQQTITSSSSSSSSNSSMYGGLSTTSTPFGAPVTSAPVDFLSSDADLRLERILSRYHPSYHYIMQLATCVGSLLRDRILIACL
jgi:CCR4-NOT transcriptional regulation complex NOT5 subunit